MLGIKWYDGLLVNSNHLTHVDERTTSLVSEVCGQLIEQSGLIGEEREGQSEGQLIEVSQCSRSEENLELRLNITRAFRALTPSGNIILGIPNNITRFGFPTTVLKTTLSAESEGEFIVSAKQLFANDLKIEASDSLSNKLELVYPGLEIDIVELAAFKKLLTSHYQDSVALAMVSAVDGEVLIDSGYIPPVVRLEFVRSFDKNILYSLNALLSDLYRIISGLVEGSWAIISKGNVGANLMSRFMDYQILKSILLAKQGMLHNMNRISPTSFLFGIIHPLARWWAEFCERQFEGSIKSSDPTSIKKIYYLANGLTEQSVLDLCSNTHTMLHDSKNFVEGLNGELGVIA